MALPDRRIVKISVVAFKQLANKRISNLQFKYLESEEDFPLNPVHASLTGSL